MIVNISFNIHYLIRTCVKTVNKWMVFAGASKIVEIAISILIHNLCLSTRLYNELYELYELKIAVYVPAISANSRLRRSRNLCPIICNDLAWE